MVTQSSIGRKRGRLFAFPKIEHRLSGHRRGRASEREQIATEALAVR